MQYGNQIKEGCRSNDDDGMHSQCGGLEERILLIVKMGRMRSDFQCPLSGREFVKPLPVCFPARCRGGYFERFLKQTKAEVKRI